jgi:hypothetical protein
MAARRAMVFFSLARFFIIRFFFYIVVSPSSSYYGKYHTNHSQLQSWKKCHFRFYNQCPVGYVARRRLIPIAGSACFSSYSPHSLSCFTKLMLFCLSPREDTVPVLYEEVRDFLWRSLFYQLSDFHRTCSISRRLTSHIAFIILVTYEVVCNVIAEVCGWYFVVISPSTSNVMRANEIGFIWCFFHTLTISSFFIPPLLLCT